MISEELQTHLDKAENLISEDSCTGYPYLSLTKSDYNLKITESTYKNYIQLVKKYGYLDHWENGKVSLFDIHPIFSNAKVIPGLMGLHLSLMLLDKQIAGTSQTLYFDTATNWLKFTKISDKRFYALSSWMRFNRESSFDETDQDDEDHFDSNPFLYVRSSIFLVKGNELADVHLKAASDFSKYIVGYYKNTPHLLKSGVDLRSILVSETQQYLDFISSLIKEQPKLKESAAYLFMLIFSREFGVDAITFQKVKVEYSYKFDFSEDEDILKYTDLSLMYIDSLKISIGEYSEPNITFKQTDETLFASDEKENRLENDPQNTYQNSEDENLKTSELIEAKKNYSVDGSKKFYEMKPALQGDEIQKKLYDQWRNLAFRFLYKKLDQESYNKLRSIVDSFVIDEIKKNKLDQFKNYDFQMIAISDAAFNIFQNSMFEYFNSQNYIYSETAINIFGQLTPPPLTEAQEREINILNTNSKKDYLKKTKHDLCQRLDDILQFSIGKIAHPNYQAQLGNDLANIDNELLKKMVISWYAESYISQYISIDPRYESVIAMIENDFSKFTKDDLINQSILKEVKNFVRVQYNPRNILDFNTNF